MSKECSKSKLSIPSLAKTYKSHVNSERSLNSRRIFNNHSNIKEKTSNKNSSKFEQQQKEVNLAEPQPGNNKMEKKVYIFEFWKNFFIGILIIQFMTQLGLFLLQYLDHTIQQEIFLLLTTSITILVAGVLLLTVKLRFSWLTDSKQNKNAIEQFKKHRYFEDNSIFHTISQSSCPTPILYANELEQSKAKPQKCDDSGNQIHQNTMQNNVERANKIIFILTIVKFIKMISFFSINTLSLTLFIPHNENKKQPAIIIGVVSYILEFLSLIVSAFFLKRADELLNDISVNQEAVQICQQKINYYPQVVRENKQNTDQKVPKFTSINDVHFDAALKSIKFVHIQSEIASQNCEKQQKSDNVLKNCIGSKKSVLKKQPSNKQQSKPSTACTERRKVQINSKKIQFFQYTELKSKKKQESSIKLKQRSAKENRLQNLKMKIKVKSKSLEKYHQSTHKTIKCQTTHRSTTTLETKASSEKYKR